MASAAREAGLDFFASTEHNTSSASLVWGRHAGDDLLVVNGEEVTTRDGHWLAVGLPAGAWVDWRYRAADDELPTFLEQVRQLGGLAIIAHPTVPIPSTGWTFGALSQADAVEVWNGPWTMDDEGTLERWQAMLVAGTFVPAVGSSDSHRPTSPSGSPRRWCSPTRWASGRSSRRSGPAGPGSRSRPPYTSGSPSAVRAARSPAARHSPPDRRTLCTCSSRRAGSRAAWPRSSVPAGPVAVGPADDAGRVRLEQTLPAAAVPFVRAEVRRTASSAEDVPTDPTTDSVGTTMVALTNPVFVTTA